MKNELGDYLLFVSWSGKIVEVTLQKEGDIYIAETRIDKNVSIAIQDTELKALAATMPPIFTTQAHSELKKQRQESICAERAEKVG